MILKKLSDKNIVVNNRMATNKQQVPDFIGCNGTEFFSVSDSSL